MCIRDRAKVALGFNEDDFVVCSFGILGQTKQNHRLFGAWLRSRLHENQRCKLIFVGENHPAEYGQLMLAQISDGKADSRIRIT